MFEDDHVLYANHETSAALNALAQPLAAHRRVRHFRNTGMIWAFEVGDLGEGGARRIYEMALARDCCCVRSVPPYTSCRHRTISKDELAMLVDRTLDIVESV